MFLLMLHAESPLMESGRHTYWGTEENYTQQAFFPLTHIFCLEEYLKQFVGEKNKGISEFSNSFYWCCWSGLFRWMFCWLCFVFFQGKKFILHAVVMTVVFVILQTQEHLAAMKEDMWVLTELTMKIYESSPRKKNQLFFSFFTGDNTMRRNLYCSQDTVTAIHNTAIHKTK